MSMSRKDQIALFTLFADRVRRAADHCGSDREYDALRDCIERGEKEHIAFGTRLLGHRPARKLTMRQRVDYFVARTIAEAIVKDSSSQPLREYAGIREDYLRAALMWCNDRFRAAMRERFADVTVDAARILDGLDYSELVKDE